MRELLDGATFSLYSGQTKIASNVTDGGKVLFGQLADGVYRVVNEDTGAEWSAIVSGGMVNVDADLTGKILASPTEAVNEIPAGYGLTLAGIGKSDTKLLNAAALGGVKLLRMTEFNVVGTKDKPAAYNFEFPWMDEPRILNHNLLQLVSTEFTKETIENFIFSHRPRWNIDQTRLIMDGSLHLNRSVLTQLTRKENGSDVWYETGVLDVDVLNIDCVNSFGEVMLGYSCADGSLEHDFIDDFDASALKATSIDADNVVTTKAVSSGWPDPNLIHHLLVCPPEQTDFEFTYRNVYVGYNKNCRADKWFSSGLKFGLAALRMDGAHWVQPVDTLPYGTIDSYSYRNIELSWNGTEDRDKVICEGVDHATPKMDITLRRKEGLFSITVNVLNADGSIYRSWTSGERFVAGEYVPYLDLYMANTNQPDHISQARLPVGMRPNQCRRLVITGNKAYSLQKVESYQRQFKEVCSDWAAATNKAELINTKGFIIPFNREVAALGKFFQIVTTKPVTLSVWSSRAQSMCMFMKAPVETSGLYYRGCSATVDAARSGKALFICSRDANVWQTHKSGKWEIVAFENLVKPTDKDVATFLNKGMTAAELAAISMDQWYEFSNRDELDRIAMGVVLSVSGSTEDVVRVRALQSEELTHEHYRELTEKSDYILDFDTADGIGKLSVYQKLDGMVLNMAVADASIIETIRPIKNDGVLRGVFQYITNLPVAKGTFELALPGGDGAVKYTISIVNGHLLHEHVEAGEYAGTLVIGDKRYQYPTAVKVNAGTINDVAMMSIPDGNGILLVTVIDEQSKPVQQSVLTLYQKGDAKVSINVIEGKQYYPGLTPGTYDTYTVTIPSGDVFNFTTPLVVHADETQKLDLKLIYPKGTLHSLLTDAAGKNPCNKYGMVLYLALTHKEKSDVKYNATYNLSEAAQAEIAAFPVRTGAYTYIITTPNKKTAATGELTITEGKQTELTITDACSVYINSTVMLPAASKNVFKLLMKTTAGTLVHSVTYGNLGTINKILLQNCKMVGYINNTEDWKANFTLLDETQNKELYHWQDIPVSINGKVTIDGTVT